MNYSEHFSSERRAANYDEKEYGKFSYSTLLWEIERGQIDLLIAAHSEHPFTYLDFACGTGRVLEHVASRASDPYGIDISKEMVARARLRVPQARIEARDIIYGPPPDETFDVISAFRFLLNAEPSLRLMALRVLAGLMDDESILIINNHGNLFSHKAVTAIPEWIRSRAGRRATGNRLTHKAVVRLAQRSGLSIHRVAGCGLLGGRLARMLPKAWVGRIERRASVTPLSWLGSNQIYVARRV